MRIFLVLLLATVCAACARPLPAGVTELTYATPYGPTHPFSRADKEWMDFVEKRSGGRLRIRPEWSGSLLSADMSMEELRHGVADVGLITPIYVRGGTHLNRIQTGFYRGADTIAQQVTLYRCLLGRDPQLGRELHGLHVLAVQGGTLPGIITRGSDLRTLADLRGKRLRAPTELLPVLRGLGADPVDMPMGDVYSAMAKGVIDGVVAPADTFKALRFVEVGHHYLAIKIPRGAYPARAIGSARWAALTDEQRQILTEGTAVWEKALDEQVNAAWQTGFDLAVKSGVEMTAIDPQDQARFDRLYDKEATASAQSLLPLGIDAPRTLALARASIGPSGTISCAGGGI